MEKEEKGVEKEEKGVEKEEKGVEKEEKGVEEGEGRGYGDERDLSIQSISACCYHVTRCHCSHALSFPHVLLPLHSWALTNAKHAYY